MRKPGRALCPDADDLPQPFANALIDQYSDILTNFQGCRCGIGDRIVQFTGCCFALPVPIENFDTEYILMFE